MAALPLKAIILVPLKIDKRNVLLPNIEIKFKGKSKINVYRVSQQISNHDKHTTLYLDKTKFEN